MGLPAGGGSKLHPADRISRSGAQFVPNQLRLGGRDARQSPAENFTGAKSTLSVRGRKSGSHVVRVRGTQLHAILK